MTEYSSLLRQINDIVNQINKVKSRKSSKSELKSILTFSNELKKYIRENIKEKEVLELIDEIEDVKLDRMHKRYWYHYLIFPWYFALMYNDTVIKDDLLPYLDETAKKYKQIHSLLDNEQ